MSNARYAIELTVTGASAVLGSVRGVAASMKNIGAAAMAVNRDIAYLTQNMMNLGRMAARIGTGGVSMVQALIGPSADLEQSQLQFENLLGSAEAAKQHIKAIQDSPISAAFDDEAVLAGSRMLMTLSDGALGAGDSLKMAGNIAAGTGADFATAAAGVGRLYAAIQEGAGAGDAVRVFKSMGLNVGTLDKTLDAMTASGASSAEMWQVVTRQFSRFDGMTEKMAGTMKGLTNSINDSFKAMKRIAGQPIFEMVKAEMAGLSGQLEGALNQQRVQVLLTGLGVEFADWIKKTRDTITGGITLNDLIDASQSGQLGELIGEQVSNIAEIVGDKAMEVGRKIGAAIAEGAKDAFVSGVQSIGSAAANSSGLEKGVGKAVGAFMPGGGALTSMGFGKARGFFAEKEAAAAAPVVEPPRVSVLQAIRANRAAQADPFAAEPPGPLTEAPPTMPPALGGRGRLGGAGSGEGGGGGWMDKLMQAGQNYMAAADAMAASAEAAKRKAEQTQRDFAAMAEAVNSSASRF